MFKNIIRYLANINEPKIICSGCYHPVGKQYSIGREYEGEFCSHYFFCGECVKKASEDAFNEASEKGEVPEKYFETVMEECCGNPTAKYAHLLMRSEEGGEILRQDGYFEN